MTQIETDGCVPERVTGYVDGVLPADERAWVESHLGSCPECARQAAEERDLRDRLRALPAPELPPHVEIKVRRALRRARPRRGRVALPIAAVLAGLFLWGRSSAPFVAWELARDHRSCFSRERLPAKVLSNDVEEVRAWFEAQGTPVPEVPAGAAGLELVGARRCPLLDRSVAHLYYVSDEGKVSIFVVPGTVRFGSAYATTALGRPVRLVRMGSAVLGVAGERREDVDAFARALSTTVAGLSGQVADAR